MDVHPIRGTSKSEKTKGWFISWYNQWPGNFSRTSNWYDITLINIEGEYAPYTGRWEFGLALLGFGLNIQYVFDDSFGMEMRARLEEVMGLEDDKPEEKR